MDSPRGRIFLMKNVLEENLQLEEALPYIDKCLGCQACVPACPSGVEYGALLTPFLARAEKQRQRGILDKINRNSLGVILSINSWTVEVCPTVQNSPEKIFLH